GIKVKGVTDRPIKGRPIGNRVNASRQDRGPDIPLHRLDHRDRKLLDAAEIEQRDATVGREEIVSGVRIRVEEPMLVDAAEHGTRENRSVSIAFGWARRRADFVECASLDELTGEDP